MKYLDRTHSSPAANLALDDFLFDRTSGIAGEETLRLWESPEPFVVVGRSNRVEQEVHVERGWRKKIDGMTPSDHTPVWIDIA